MIEEASETFIGTLRTVARVFGTLTAVTLLIELVVKLRSLLGFAPLVLILSFSAYLIIFAGFLAGWKSDRLAAFLIIGGLALAVGIELLLSRRVCSRPIYLISIVIGLLYLYTWSRDGR